LHPPMTTVSMIAAVRRAIHFQCARRGVPIFVMSDSPMRGVVVADFLVGAFHCISQEIPPHHAVLPAN